MSLRYDLSRAFVLSVFVFSKTLFASDAQPLLTKTIEWTGDDIGRPPLEVCSVYPDRIEIRKSYGYNSDNSVVFSSVETIKVAVDSFFSVAVLRAFTEPLVESVNELCDPRRSSITAYTSDGMPLVIFTDGGCGEKRKMREGINSGALRKYILSHCPSL